MFVIPHGLLYSSMLILCILDENSGTSLKRMDLFFCCCFCQFLLTFFLQIVIQQQYFFTDFMAGGGDRTRTDRNCVQIQGKIAVFLSHKISHVSSRHKSGISTFLQFVFVCETQFLYRFTQPQCACTVAKHTFKQKQLIIVGHLHIYIGDYLFRFRTHITLYREGNEHTDALSIPQERLKRYLGL